ncbi:hypothetical protein BaRGS_00026113 [Batillaria attramentaria]|uniref:Uncharacterized protein n=1 Tax=Batillaria attramentaria TaxID=370345 RepID=A0ABD0K5V5_9CAEN
MRERVKRTSRVAGPCARGASGSLSALSTASSLRAHAAALVSDRNAREPTRSDRAQRSLCSSTAASEIKRTTHMTAMLTNQIFG